MLDQCGVAFKQSRTAERARQLAYGVLACLGRHTLTSVLTASGLQFVDWSSAYRFFTQQRFKMTDLFKVVLQNVLQEVKDDQDIVAHMDDTIIRKTGKMVCGAGWRRDPLGPPFHTNFIWGQRFLQISMALPHGPGLSQSRAIPVDFHHCPTVKKPKKSDSEQDWKQYREKQSKAKLSRQGVNRICVLREELDAQGVQDKQLLISVDGSYANATVLKSLPDRVTLIGRIRKDTKLYKFPEHSSGVGRNRVYGERLPTPEQIRQSDEYPWQQVECWAAGKTHSFDVKILKDVRWRSAGGQHDLQLVVIRPLGYRLTKKSRILYRQPAYLICTDVELNIDKLLQAYLWRWEIEVNFRDQKTLLGCGEAQVRNPQSVEKVPAFITAIYAMLLVAAHRASKTEDNIELPRPKWYPKKTGNRQSTGDIINLLRTQMWGKAIGINNFSGFVEQQHLIKSLRNKADPLTSALFYMRK